MKSSAPGDVARWLGFVPDAPRLVAWDAFDAVLTPGDIILLLTWRDRTAAETFEKTVSLPKGAPTLHS